MSLFWSSGKYDDEMEEIDKMMEKREEELSRRLTEGQSAKDYEKQFTCSSKKEVTIHCKDEQDGQQKYATAIYIPPFKRGTLVKRIKTSERASYEFRSMVLNCFLKSDGRTWLVACESFVEPGLVHIFGAKDLEVIKL